jgi:hypothetical protein
MYTVHSFSSLVAAVVGRQISKETCVSWLCFSQYAFPEVPVNWYFLDHRRGSLLPRRPCGSAALHPLLLLRVVPSAAVYQFREPILDIFAHNFARWYEK